MGATKGHAWDPEGNILSPPPEPAPEPEPDDPK